MTTSTTNLPSAPALISPIQYKHRLISYYDLPRKLEMVGKNGPDILGEVYWADYKTEYKANHEIALAHVRALYMAYANSIFFGMEKLPASNSAGFAQESAGLSSVGTGVNPFAMIRDYLNGNNGNVVSSAIRDGESIGRALLRAGIDPEDVGVRDPNRPISREERLAINAVIKLSGEVVSGIESAEKLPAGHPYSITSSGAYKRLKDIADLRYVINVEDPGPISRETLANNTDLLAILDPSRQLQIIKDINRIKELVFELNKQGLNPLGYMKRMATDSSVIPL